ncbi:MAG: serine hydrolase domain-containing protein [Chitinophagales bacterium]
MNVPTEFLELHGAPHKTPCIQYAFFTAEEMVFHFEKGFADIGKRQNISAQHTINAFSVTKTFTALAVLQLAIAGKFKISDPIKNWLPLLPYPDGISIAQLLYHSAGIPNPLPLNWIHLVSEHESFDRNAFFEKIFLKNQKVGSRPNEKYSYSNLGYVILGQLIEKVAELPYEKYIEEQIIQKISVSPSDLGFIHPDGSIHATGYQKQWSIINLLLGLFIDKSKFTGKVENAWLPFNYFYVNGTSYGGLIASLNGLIKYAQALLQARNPFLSEEYFAMLFRENKTNNGKSTGMCCSWFSGSLKGVEYFCHAGGGGGYYCEIRLYPLIKRGSVVMFNRSGMSDERFLDRVDQYFIR